MSRLHEIAAFTEGGQLHVVVESPSGATTKLKYDPRLGAFAVSRPLPLGLFYPHDWGFVPGTRGEDGDPVDALVLAEGTMYPGVVLVVRPLGVVQIEQNRKDGGGRERNDRLLGVQVAAARRDVDTYADLSERVRAEIEAFFLDTALFEHKDAVVLGWGGVDEATELVRSAVVARTHRRRTPARRRGAASARRAT